MVTALCEHDLAMFAERSKRVSRKNLSVTLLGHMVSLSVECCFLPVIGS